LLPRIAKEAPFCHGEGMDKKLINVLEQHDLVQVEHELHQVNG